MSSRSLSAITIAATRPAVESCSLRGLCVRFVVDGPVWSQPAAVVACKKRSSSHVPAHPCWLSFCHAASADSASVAQDASCVDRAAPRISISRRARIIRTRVAEILVHLSSRGQPHCSPTPSMRRALAVLVAAAGQSHSTESDAPRRAATSRKTARTSWREPSTGRRFLAKDSGSITSTSWSRPAA